MVRLESAVTGGMQRQVSAPLRPESLMLNSMLDDLDQLSKDLDSCLESGHSSSSTGVFMWVRLQIY